MGKNLIICCDGTGNEIKENQSNVLKFFRLLKDKDTVQLSYYDPGVGTLSDSSAWDRFNNNAKGVFGLITGYGLDDNVLEAYRFLIRNYQYGDQIYLFGFSRGAYTVRVLAGFINMVGLLHPSNENLCGYGLLFRDEMAKQLVDGKNPKNSTRYYSSPNSNGDLHNSMNPGWSVLEWLPKFQGFKKNSGRKSFLGLSLRRGEPRRIEKDELIDPSVLERHNYCQGRPYKPENQEAFDLCQLNQWPVTE